MASRKKQFIINVVVVILGYFVGFADLIRWFNDNSLKKEFVLGTLCTALATGWLVYIIKSKNK